MISCHCNPHVPSCMCACHCTWVNFDHVCYNGINLDGKIYNWMKLFYKLNDFTFTVMLILHLAYVQIIAWMGFDHVCYPIYTGINLEGKVLIEIIIVQVELFHFHYHLNVQLCVCLNQYLDGFD